MFPNYYFGGLMRLMALMPAYQKPNISKVTNGHKTYPYLLRGLRVGRPNQVWCANITYQPPLSRFALQIACRAINNGQWEKFSDRLFDLRKRVGNVRSTRSVPNCTSNTAARADGQTIACPIDLLSLWRLV